MAIPTKKTEGIEDFLTQFLGTSRLQSVRENTCVTCKGEARVFRNALSRKEYTISGMCQGCQDKVFR